MSSPPETDREYAYFRAIGSFNPEDVTKALSIEPNESWSTGDKFERRGHVFRRRGSNWKLDSGHLDTEELELHISTLLNKLRRHRNGLLHISTFAQIQFVCVGHYYQSFSFELNFEHQKELTALGIGLWFDTYSSGDQHEQMVELREQLNVRKEGHEFLD